MHIEKRAKFSGRIVALHALMQRFKLGANGGERRVKALQFVVNLLRRNVVVRHLQRRMRHQLRARNGNARCRSNAVQDKRNFEKRLGRCVHSSMVSSDGVRGTLTPARGSKDAKYAPLFACRNGARVCRLHLFCCNAAKWRHASFN